MKRLIYLSLVLLLLSGCDLASATPAVWETPTALPQDYFAPPVPSMEAALTPTHSPVRPSSLRRGINLGNMLEAPNEGDWGLTVQEEYFDLIREAGFDFVRLPVRWFAHTRRIGHDDGNSGYEIEPAFFARVDEVVGWALERDLKIIIDLHHYDELMAEPNEEQFLFMWRQIAEHYQDYPSEVLFELLNEPRDRVDAALWNVYIADTLKLIRRTNPTRDVIFGPVNWNAYDWISTLDVPQDEHIIVTFHYYLPFRFTHQGAEWVENSDFWLGTTWPDNDERKREVVRDFEQVADWAQRHNVPILLGEFGAYSKADMESRVRWTEFVRREAERHGFAWAYWEWASGFGVYDPKAKVVREDLLKALIL